jgi:ferritin-like protein
MEGSSRAAFLRRAALTGGAVVAGGVVVTGLPRIALAGPSVAQDRKILNFALLLEYLQAAFYGDGFANGKLKGDVRDFAKIVGGHEREHVSFLKKQLGSHARRKPAFEFGNSTRSQRKFVAAAVALEDIGVAAYNGQVASLTRGALSAATAISSVEGRHAAWIRDIAGVAPAPFAADPPKTGAEVTAALKATGFLRR